MVEQGKNTVPHSPPLDAAWYPQMVTLGAFELPEYFSGDREWREEQKKLFLAGGMEQPRLDYPHLSEISPAARIAQLDKLAWLIKNQEPNQIVREAYLTRLAEKIIELQMLRAAQENDMAKFSQATRRLYGQPSKSFFRLALELILNEVAAAPELDRRSLAVLARPLADILTKLPVPPGQSPPNFSREKAYLAEFVRREKDQLIAPGLIVDETLYAGSEVESIFNQVLRRAGATGWRATIDRRGATHFSVDQVKKQIKIPFWRTVPGRYLIRLILHEIGVHIIRRVNGERSRLKLLGLGLDHYYFGEEGWAMVKDQVFCQAKESPGGLGYFLAVGLALGLDGPPRNFRQVYELMNLVGRLRAAAGGQIGEEAKKKANESAYGVCVNVFRGTDCVTPGACYPKDMVYFQGAMRLWSAVKQTPTEVKRFPVGKYDPANKSHREILNQLGIQG